LVDFVDEASFASALLLIKASIERYPKDDTSDALAKARQEASSILSAQKLNDSFEDDSLDKAVVEKNAELIEKAKKGTPEYEVWLRKYRAKRGKKPDVQKDQVQNRKEASSDSQEVKDKVKNILESGKKDQVQDKKASFEDRGDYSVESAALGSLADYGWEGPELDSMAKVLTAGFGDINDSGGSPSDGSFYFYDSMNPKAKETAKKIAVRLAEDLDEIFDFKGADASGKRFHVFDYVGGGFESFSTLEDFSKKWKDKADFFN